jgi:hypothetical protein
MGTILCARLPSSERDWSYFSATKTDNHHMGRRTVYSTGADTAAEAEALRRHFVDAVKALSPDQALDESSGYFRVERETAQKAFSGWTYPEITRWASNNGLMADFVSGGAIVLHDFESELQQPYSPGDVSSLDRSLP